MSGIKVPFIAVCLVVLLEISSTHGWLKWPSIRIMPVTKPTTKPTTTPPPQLAAIPVPQCRSKEDVNKILEQKDSGITKRATSWPYDCTYASIVKYQGNYQFIWPIHDCCEKCDFPAFTACVAARSSSPSWVCPSDGLHCIVDCVKNHGPSSASTEVEIKPGLGSGISKPSVVKPGIGDGLVPSITGTFKCTAEKTINGQKCIEQLCVPLLKT